MITENLNDLLDESMKLGPTPPSLVFKVTPIDSRRPVATTFLPSIGEALEYSKKHGEMRIEVIEVSLDAATMAHAMSGVGVGNLVKVIFPPT
jgi:hypothetical protein